MIRKALANLVVKHLCLILLFLGANQDMCLGASFDGTQTYLRYLIVLVHGIGGNFANWTDKKYDEIKNININDLSSYNKYGGFKKHLEKPVSEGGLGLKGYVYAYTFSSPCGAAKDNAKELGDRTYNNPTPGMSGQCWLEKAQNDFIDNFKRDVGRAPLPSETPEKYILIVHSMGNYAARGYIYSEQLRDFFDEGFYAYDVDKVIFVDAVLNGSTMTYIPYMTAYAKGTFLSDRFNELLKNGLPTFDWQFVKKRSFLENFANIYEMSKDKIFEMFTPYIKDQLLGGDIFGPYQFAGDFSGVVIMAPQFYSSLGGLRAPNEAWKGLPDLFPSEIGRTTRVLNKVKSLGIEDEPSYSIVYSSGMPVFEPYSSGVIMLSKSLKDNGLVDFNNKYVNDFLGLNYQKMTFVHPSFYSLPTAQSKFMSLLMARYGVGFFTNDGDGAVNVQSQKGEGIAVLSSAPRYQKVFKSDGFENYLNNDFATQVFIVEGAMVGTAALMAAGGTPYIIAWQNLWPMRLIPAASLITNVYAYKPKTCVKKGYFTQAVSIS